MTTWTQTTEGSGGGGAGGHVSPGVCSRLSRACVSTAAQHGTVLLHDAAQDVGGAHLPGPEFVQEVAYVSLLSRAKSLAVHIHALAAVQVCYCGRHRGLRDGYQQHANTRD
jgi:hypothetical protein